MLSRDTNTANSVNLTSYEEARGYANLPPSYWTIVAFAAVWGLSSWWQDPGIRWTRREGIDTWPSPTSARKVASIAQKLTYTACYIWQNGNSAKWKNDQVILWWELGPVDTSFRSKSAKIEWPRTGKWGGNKTHEASYFTVTGLSHFFSIKVCRYRPSRV